MQTLNRLQSAFDAESEIHRWHELGLPIPPSWRVDKAALTDRDALHRELEVCASGVGVGSFWVMQQGLMNARSLRQSLVNLDSVASLLIALDEHFSKQDDEVVVQLLPGWQAAGVLFTRHPLRQDLDHLVVEGVAGEQQAKQRLIVYPDGRLAFRSRDDDALDSRVPLAELVALGDQLKASFDKPQAAEWVYDGKQLWLLQTLPIGSLPSPKEAWSRHGNDDFWYAAVTPLWYTLESRWLKNRFWEPLVKKQRWHTLEKVEPYRRQHSHIYRNSQFLRRLRGFSRSVPPAWREQDARQPSPTLSLPGLLAHALVWLQLYQVEKRLNACLAGTQDHWRRLLELDLLGEELATATGVLHYRVRAQIDVPLVAQLPLAISQWMTTGRTDELRAGMDPVHAAMLERPSEAMTLPALTDEQKSRLAQALPALVPRSWEDCLVRATRLRGRLANALRQTLQYLAAELLQQGLLTQAEDIHFHYYDELWRLCQSRKKEQQIALATLGKRKLRYLEDAHAGAPDWKLDQLGFGFNQDHQPHELLLGYPVVSGVVQGTVRRITSAWMLNQVRPGDLVVMHACDPHWLPWLCQAAGLVLASHDTNDVGFLLAKALDIPCVHGLDDAMHCLTDGETVCLDATAGRVTRVKSGAHGHLSIVSK